ncbi:hypothetical protein XANCAGTX0491_002075 [Xanthoria calcicola]
MAQQLGTPAGDPVEAEAIHTAFYGSQSGFQRAHEGQKLLVGSIKTIIGHTEGTAGLASLLKASLALQHGEIAPNLHLDRLHPAVQPFYSNLEIPTQHCPWPTVESGGVKRASVNSFGFRGANAHAILEAYEQQDGSQTSPAAVFSPLIFSASSERALSATLEAYAHHFQAFPEISLRDVAYTLRTGRSLLPKRAIVSATSISSLCEKHRSEAKSEGNRDIPVRSSTGKPKILGIFTGQGAQWARMGVETIEASPAALQILKDLEQSLMLLPLPDRPSWSIVDELLAEKHSSRVDQAEISQAALYRSTDYASCFLSASDAIRIAYYRGFHLNLGQGPQGKQGAMMAAGTTFDDAQELCRLDDFNGRLCVAASNSSNSVTLSGDADAIAEAKDVLEAEEKFVRRLKVDKAYHSSHVRRPQVTPSSIPIIKSPTTYLRTQDWGLAPDILHASKMSPCSESYVESLQECGISSTTSGLSKCHWISSVYADDITKVDDRLESTYWMNNLLRPVLFSQAVTSALSEKGPFDQVLEVGPHPPLKGPVIQTIEEVAGEKIPYFSCFNRGRNSVEALAEGLGQLWADQASDVLNLDEYESFLSGVTDNRLIKNLPKYQWDHERTFYHESRISKARRTHPQPSHELLGTKQPDNCSQDIRWRNLLNPREVPWLKDHQVQGQPVYPGAGYVATALAAIQASLQDANISIIEIRDFVIGQALIIEDDHSVEILVSLTNIQRTDTGCHAHFAFFSQESKESANMVENASCDIQVQFGELDAEALPSGSATDNQTFDLEESRFYNAVSRFGYGYTGPFRALSGLKRKLDVATGYITVPEPTPTFRKLLVHPAALDAAIQSMILAFCYPGDTSLRTIQLPTGIDCIRFNVPLYASTVPGSMVPFRSSVKPGESDDINGDVEIYRDDGRTTIVQLNLSIPEGELKEEKKLFHTVERVAYFYLKNLDKAITKEARRNLADYQKCLFHYLKHTLSKVERGGLTHIRPEYLLDTHEDIRALISERLDSIDLQLMQAVGEILPAVMRGEMNMLEPMVRNNMLNRFYTDALGMKRYLQDLTRMAAQISHRYPHMSVLEVGAGTGGATKVILRELGNAFGSYYYTDISTGFFNEAKETFRAHEAKMTFRALDIEKDIVEQGFEEQSYDLLIANLVVHATKNLEHTMRNLRRLGTGTKSSQLTQELRRFLLPKYRNVTVAFGLDNVLVHDMALMGSVIVVADLDTPVFDGITRLRLQAFQQKFKRSRNVSWVTSGRRGGNLWANMVVGAGRNIVLEMEHVRLQFVDFDDPSEVSAVMAASKHLQFEASDTWERRNKAQNLPRRRVPPSSHLSKQGAKQAIQFFTSFNGREHESKSIVVSSFTVKTILWDFQRPFPDRGRRPRRPGYHSRQSLHPPRS